MILSINPFYSLGCEAACNVQYQFGAAEQVLHPTHARLLTLLSGFFLKKNLFSCLFIHSFLYVFIWIFLACRKRSVFIIHYETSYLDDVHKVSGPVEIRTVSS